MDRIPDHSTFSQNRKRRFQDSQLDGSFIPANVSWASRTEIPTIIEQSTVKYLDALDEELSQLPGYSRPVPTEKEKVELKSNTDMDCGYIHQERKKGLGYLAEMTVDTKHGIITGVDCYPANRRESDIILGHIHRQMKETGINIQKIGLDAGYDIGAVHRGFELLGITDYCSIREMHNHAMKKGFSYCSDTDCFICDRGKQLVFSRIVYKKASHEYSCDIRPAIL